MRAGATLWGMHRLTREVRFAINSPPDTQLGLPPANSYAGHPGLTGFAPFLRLQVTLTGALSATGYLRNIKEIDHQVRAQAIPLLQDLIASPKSTSFVPDPGSTVTLLFATLRQAWPGATLDRLKLSLSPFLSVHTCAKDFPMTYLSQKFEFSASHRLHAPALSAEANRETYGKCNNPNGHGHNYELQVTLAGTPDPATGILVELPAFERTVADVVIAKFDHKNLNVELEEFRSVVPSVENIAGVIYGLLKPQLATPRTRLASVTVWETPKTFCEYSEEG